jgi:TolB-like protein
VSFFNELKRRNVFRVTAAYVVMSWVLLQVADILLEAFGVPAWAFRLLFLLLAIGLVPVALFAWAFELTPEGIKRDSEIDRSQSIAHETGRKLNYLTIAMVVLGVAFVLLQPYVIPRTQDKAVTEPIATVSDETGQPPPAVTREAAANKRSIAVLPFVNMSADPENEYFADGLSEELLNQLAQIHDLQVAGRTSSFSYKGKNEDLRVIGSTLGVANVLEGSVRRQGNQVRVTAQLIRVDDGFHLWSETYDRTMDDVFAIQDDIARNVADAMKIILDDDAWRRMQAAGVRNVDAFIEYQKGKQQFAMAHGSINLLEDMRVGLVHFNRAIDLVPEFGAAYWDMSDYFGHIILDNHSKPGEQAEALAELRRVLDAAWRYSGDSPRKAFIDVERVLFSDDWTPLHDRIEKAVAVEGCPAPNWIELAVGIGHAEEMLDVWERFQRCEPLNVVAPMKVAQAELSLGNFERSLKLLEQAEIQMGSNAWFASTKSWVYLAMGRAEDALALAPEIEQDVEFAGITGRPLPLALMGDADAARDAMNEWIAQHGRNQWGEITINAAIGDREGANRLAAAMDARPGGSFLLLLTSVYCGCGAPFDLEYTPVFRERLEESGTDWPLKTLVHFPAKDW